LASTDATNAAGNGSCTYSIPNDKVAVITPHCTSLIEDPSLDEEEAATACEGDISTFLATSPAETIPAETRCGYTGAGTCEMVRPSGQKDPLPTDNSDYNKYNTEARCNVHTP
jgi:hypothetical protein